jgi:hypothetical protein
MTRLVKGYNLHEKKTGIKLNFRENYGYFKSNFATQLK